MDTEPRNEVMGREGYYRDWTHLDPNILHSIAELAKFIRDKGHGIDTREALAQILERAGFTSEEAINISNRAQINSAEALTKSIESALKANQAISSASNLQQQVNSLVLSGDSSPAADQAKVDDKGFTHPTLKRRIDSSDLAKYRIKNGKIKLPSDFPKRPFDIFKVSDWNFTHNATPYNQHDWSTATEVFIAGLGATTGVGTSASTPITLETFHANVTSNLYGAQKDFILSFINTYYTVYSSVNLGNLHKNLFLRSVSLKGKTYMHPFSLQGGSAVSQPWVADVNIFKTTITGTSGKVPINTGAGEDEFGISNPHIPVASVSEVRNLVGAYYHDLATKTIYLHAYPSEVITDGESIMMVGNRVFDVTNTSNNVLIFENLHFINGAYRLNPSTIETKLYFFGCKFYKGAQDAFAITGAYTAYLLDCVGAYPNKDAFNYHTTDPDSLAVEVNGRGYGAGQYKYIGEGNQGRGSNNGSTAHDSMYMLRVGGEYWDCEGPIIADVGNCYSISIGCRSFDILSTATTSLMSGLYVENQEGLTLEQEKPKYFIECEQHGKHFTQGVRGVRSNKTYVQAVNVDIGEGQLIDWEDVV